MAELEEMELQLSGEIDMVTAAAYQAAGQRLLASGCRRLIMNVGGVTFADSQGLAMLLTLRNAAVAVGGTVALKDVPHQLAKLLQISGTADLFPPAP